jgi:lipoprotein-anchoring transpeptidase ErfK/SrfK
MAVLCVLLSSCGSADDLPAMRHLGATTETLPKQGTLPPTTGTATTAPPETTTGTATTAPPETTTGTATTAPPETTTTSSIEPVPSAVVVTAAPDVVLLEAFREAAEGESWWLFPNPGPFDGARVLLAADVTDPEWVQVHLPVRPNGRTGWVRRSDVVLSTVTTRIVVELGRRRLTVYDGSEVLATAEATIGAPETPTPTGLFYVNQIQVEVDPDTERGAGLFGTSAFSEVLGIIDGGEPAVAVHGTNQPELLGEAASLGCIRVADEVIELLISLALPLGTPVEILA